MQDIGLTDNQSIFINTSLCPYDLITENSIPITITKDFTKYFPDADLIPTSL